MPDRPNFPIPENIHAELMCLQLMIPNDPTWKSVVAGLLYELQYWFNWQRDEARSGRECAAVWKEIYLNIDWSDMSCCCDEKPPKRYRWGEDGELEQSDDGGETWTPAPDYDPRNYSPEFPPLSEPDEDDRRCLAATSIAEAIKAEVGSQITDDMTRYTLDELIRDWVTTWLETTDPLRMLLTVVANQIFALGLALLVPALTDEVYDQLKCIMYENMPSDNVFNAAQAEAARAQVQAEIGGIAGLFLQHLVYLLGAAGLTNLGRSGFSTSGDCSECEPPTCFTSYMPYCGIGEIVSVEEDHIVVECAASSITGGYGIALTTGNPAFGCYVTDVQTIEGVSFAPLSAWRTMAQDIPECGGGFGNANVYCNQTHTFVLYGLSDGQLLKIFLSDEPCPP